MTISAPPDLISPTLQLPGVYDAVLDHVTGITRQNRKRKARYLTGLLLAAYEGTRRHQAPASVADLGAVSFPSEQLVRQLGEKRDDKTGLLAYQRHLFPFFDFPTGNAGYSHHQHLTKHYKLKNSATTLIDVDLMSNEAAEVVNRDSGRFLTEADFPENGVYRTSYSSIKVPSIVRLDVARLDSKIANAAAALEEGSVFKQYHARRRLHELRVVRKWVATLGGIPNLYSDFKGADPLLGHGRLYGSGSGHLQWMRGATRRIVLSGAGLWAFDFKSSNFALLESLAAAVGVDAGAVGEYRADKDTINDRFSTLFDVKLGDIKNVFLAMIYGGEPVPHPTKTICRLLGGPKNTVTFRDDPFVSRFQRDLRALLTSIYEGLVVDAVPAVLTKDGFLNVVGKRQPYFETVVVKGKEKQKKIPIRDDFSHIVQGYEAWCLNAVLRDRKDVTCLVFDGWVGEKADVNELSDVILERSIDQLGFPIDIEIKAEELV